MRVIEHDNTYDDIFVTLPETSYFEKMFKSKVVSIADLIGQIEMLYFDLEHEREEKEDIINDRDSNYKPLSHSDYTGDARDDYC